ncbi:MAG: hypothetical protein AB7U20_17820 [Planctomycetaceae bacterium]
MSYIRGILIATALLATVASTLRVYPHQLAYFNELAGGPENGYTHLLGSNIDWGQGLVEVRDWLARHETRRPVFLGHQGELDPGLLGVNNVLPVTSIGAGEALPPGWYLVSSMLLLGGGTSRDGAGRESRIRFETAEALRRARRVGSLGYVIEIIHVPHTSEPHTSEPRTSVSGPERGAGRETNGNAPPREAGLSAAACTGTYSAEPPFRSRP